MAPTIPSAKLTLSCPLFAADFDPRNNGFLLVAGGGGEGRSGVGNRIALLNTSRRNGLSQIVDIELSRDEDSVTSLAAAQASDESIVTLAGINSSLAEQKRDNNQHLRSFKIDFPPRKSAASSPEVKEASGENEALGKTTPLSRASVFRTKGASSGSDTYQRILRLSPWRGAEFPRVAAIATGMAPSGEIVLFNGVTETPTEKDVIGRIRLGDGEEAEDLDIMHLEEDGKFKVAYTNGVDIFICHVSSETRSNAAPEVTRVYSTPLPEKGTPRPKFRSLRFLSSTTLLVLQNAPSRGGSELMVFNLPVSTSPKKSPEATIVRRKKLRKTIKIGLGLDVCNLGENPEQQQQSIIAVSGSDQSIEILTLESDSKGGHRKLQPYTSLRDVHPFAMTKICFSTFIPPSHPVTPEVGPQYVKLASVSMGNTVVVHTFPLSPFPPPSRTPRYVLVNPGASEIWNNTISGLSALISILTVCILLQAFTEIRGLTPPYMGVSDWLPPTIRDTIAVPYNMPPLPGTAQPSIGDPVISPSLSSAAIPTTTEVVEEAPQQPTLRDLVRDRDAVVAIAEADTPLPPSIIVRCSDADILIETAITASPNLQDEKARPWEQLGEEEQIRWKQHLADAGHWAIEEGETILQGVLFGEYCGFVGDVVQEELL
ncbi:hypothetical protein AWENTII_003884 [Aspergillus wentii]